MPGVQINTYSVGDPQPDRIMETLDMTNRGKSRVTLTEFATAMRPDIKAGSVIDIAGALIEFQADENITGSPANGDVYIVINAGTLTASFTNTAPTWRDDHQGWYDSAGVNRYVPYVIDKAGSDWMKAELVCANNKIFRIYADGSVVFDKMIVSTIEATTVDAGTVNATTVDAGTVNAWTGNITHVNTDDIDVGNEIFVANSSGFIRMKGERDFIIWKDVSIEGYDLWVRKGGSSGGSIYADLVNGDTIEGPKRCQTTLNISESDFDWARVRGDFDKPGIYLVGGYISSGGESGAMEVITRIIVYDNAEDTVTVFSFNNGYIYSYNLKNDGTNELSGCAGFINI